MKTIITDEELENVIGSLNIELAINTNDKADENIIEAIFNDIKSWWID